MTIASASPQQASTQQANLAVQKSTETTEAGNFLALLNIGSVSTETDTAPTAAPVAKDAPQRISSKENTATYDTRTESSATKTTDATPRNPDDNDATPREIRQHREAAPASHTEKTDKPQKSEDSKNNADDKPASNTVEKNSGKTASGKTDNEEDIAARQKKIREQLGDQLNSISQILQALIDALSGNKLNPIQTGNTPFVTTAATELSSAQSQTETTETPTPIVAAGQTPTPVLTDLTTLLTNITTGEDAETITAAPTTPQTSGTTTAAATITPSSTGQIIIPTALLNATDTKEDIVLLKDIQSLLQKLQDSVKNVDTKTTTSTTAANTPNTASPTTTQPQPPITTLQALVDTVQQDVSALAQHFIQTLTNEPATITVTSDTASQSTTPALSTPLPTVSDNAKPQTVLTLLKDSIAQIRDRLQSLQNDNEAIYAQAKTTLQQQFEAAQSNFRQTFTSAPSIAADTTITTDAAITTGAPATTSLATTLSNLQTPATPVAITITQTPIENGTGGQTSQQQNQGQQQPSAATPVSSGQTGTTELARSEAPSFARSLARTQSEPLSEQVAFQVKNAVNDGTSRIRIQLDPADLGKMDIKLTVDANGKTGVNILVDNKSTLELLQRDASSLTRALNDAGLTTDGSSLSFNLRGGQQEGQGNNQQAASTYKKAQPDEEVPVLNIISRQYVVNLAEGLDIKI